MAQTSGTTSAEPKTEANASAAHPTFRQAVRFWLKLGLISFGGPTGQIAIMHAELVDRQRWISEARFLHALNYCMLLPGPEAMQLATYVGWLLHRTAGGIVAGALFVLPSAVLLWLLSYVYVTWGGVPVISAAFDGLKPAVAAIVAAAVLRIGSRALKNRVMWTIAAAAFVSIYFLKAPFPLIVLLAALIGFVGGRLRPDLFVVIRGHAGGGAASVLADDHASPDHARPSWRRALRVLLVCTLLWWMPVAIAALVLGPSHTLAREGVFFSKAAMVTFGGAYAVLPYVAQQAVEKFGWLSAGQMLDGLGLAESTPGPLIMVVQFVGFLGGWRQPGGLSPLVAATLGAALTTWTTFLPCFLWIFLGAPYIEQTRGNQQLSAALSTITAAVVGVVLNLAVWFALHVLRLPGGGPNWFAIVVAAAAFAIMTRWKVPIHLIVAAAAALGVARLLPA